ncbi:MAG: hypothetical protein ACRDIF_06910, partial [Actinomycetota bacterium]
ANLCLDAKCASVPIYLERAEALGLKPATPEAANPPLVRFGPPVRPRPDDDPDSFTRRLYEAVKELAGDGEE